MASVSTGDVIVLSEIDADTNRYGLFTYIQVNRAWKHTPAPEDSNPLLEIADLQHLPIDREQVPRVGSAVRFVFHALSHERSNVIPASSLNKSFEGNVSLSYPP